MLLHDYIEDVSEKRNLERGIPY